MVVKRVQMVVKRVQIVVKMVVKILTFIKLTYFFCLY